MNTRLSLLLLLVPGIPLEHVVMSGEHSKTPVSPVPVVEAESVVYDWNYVDWGATPLWCYSNTCIVRIGKDVFAGGLEDPRIDKSQWTLFKLEKNAWALQQKDRSGSTREPCPLGCFQDGRISLSYSPLTRHFRPELLVFNAKAPPRTRVPRPRAGRRARRTG